MELREPQNQHYLCSLCPLFTLEIFQQVILHMAVSDSPTDRLKFSFFVILVKSTKTPQSYIKYLATCISLPFTFFSLATQNPLASRSLLHLHAPSISSYIPSCSTVKTTWMCDNSTNYTNLIKWANSALKNTFTYILNIKAEWDLRNHHVQLLFCK